MEKKTREGQRWIQDEDLSSKNIGSFEIADKERKRVLVKHGNTLRVRVRLRADDTFDVLVMKPYKAPKPEKPLSEHERRVMEEIAHHALTGE